MLSTRQRSMVFVTCAAAALLAGMGDAWGQSFKEAGPSIVLGTPGLANSADLPATDQDPTKMPINGSISGAIQALVISPVDKNLWLAGSPSGGIFRSTDAGKTWTATTDNLRALFISNISFDLTDLTGKRLIASRTRTSSGYYFSNQIDAPPIYSNDGGLTWSEKPDDYVKKSFNSAIIRGSTIIGAFTGESRGLYRSIDGGRTFSSISLDNSSVKELVTGLVADPSNPNRMYVSMALEYSYKEGDLTPAKTSLFATENNGASWIKIFSASDAAGLINKDYVTSLRVAAGPDGSLAVMVISNRQVVGLFASRLKPGCTDEQSRKWINLSSALTNPAEQGTGPGSDAAPEDEEEEEVGSPRSVNPGYQAHLHSSVAIDPTDPSVIYIAGDRIEPAGPSGYSANMLRFKLNDDDSFTFQPLTDDFTSDKSTIHPDNRVLIFDKDNNLVSANDGGIYFRTSPKTTTGVWRGLNSGRQALEIYSVGIDDNSGRLGVAAQDNGTSVQSRLDPKKYNFVNAGDGTLAYFNAKSVPGVSYFYSAAQYLGGFSRARYKSNANDPDQFVSYTFVNPENNTDIDTRYNLYFVPIVKFNNIDPSYIFFGSMNFVGSKGVYPFVAKDIFEDPAKYVDPNCTTYCGMKLTVNFAKYVTDRDPLVFNISGNVNSVDFGTNDNKFALLATAYGYSNSKLYFLWRNTGNTLETMKLTPVTSFEGGGFDSSVIFDPRSQDRFFVSSASTGQYALWGTIDGGLTGKYYGQYLPDNISELHALSFINSNGVNALLIGGHNTVDNGGNPIVVADSSSTGELSGWRRFGTGLPNVAITQMVYSAPRNTLAVGTFGRGAFLLYDVTTYFSSAKSLQFGMANNDSVPSDTYLTGARPLEKFGSGTLVLTGNPTYTGGTFVKEGLVINNAYSKSNWQIDDAGVVSGIGQIDGAVTLNGGRLEPGYEGQGGLTISALNASEAGGSVKLQANSLYQTYLKVAGTANLTGIAVNLIKDGDVGVGTGSTSFKVASALVLTAQNVTGTFKTDPSDKQFDFGQVKPGEIATRLRYDLVANGVVFEQIQTLDWTQYGKTANQLALAKALNPSQLAGSDAWRSALTAISGDKAIDRPMALTALSGIGTVNSALSNQVAVQAVMTSLADQMFAPGQETEPGPSASRLARLAPQLTNAQGLFDLARTAQALSADEVGSSTDEPSLGRAWSTAFSLSGRLKDVEGELRTTGAGLVGGYDQAVGPNTRIGYGAAYTELKSKTLSDRSENQSQYWSVAAYASHRFGPVLTGLSASYSGGEISTRRTLVLPGATTDARGDTQSHDLAAMAFIAAKRDLAPGWSLVGKAAATYSDMRQDAMTEKGAGPFAVEVQKLAYQQLVAQAGAQVRHQIKLKSGSLKVYAEAQAYGRSLDKGPAAQVRFANHQTDAFQIQGAQTPTSWAALGLGAHYAPTDRLDIGLNYRNAKGQGLKQDMLSLTAAYTW